ncbi:MAG: hypothetical protein HXL38_000175 [Candidatus Saccharimonas sp.]|nr:MAG: hypothetical protein HXL38_000175 [Candidatus Saccharimonas sp.]
MKKFTKPQKLKDIIIISLVVFNFIVSIFAIFLGVQFYIQKDALSHYLVQDLNTDQINYECHKAPSDQCTKEYNRMVDIKRHILSERF